MACRCSREEKRKLTVIQQYLNTVLSLVAIVVFTPCSHGMKKNSITGSVTMLNISHLSEEKYSSLYLYRHIQTEAIKILLPIQIMDAKASIEMFKAGIVLGMKAYYRSSPEHIRIDTYSEMNQATQRKLLFGNVRYNPRWHRASVKALQYRTIYRLY